MNFDLDIRSNRLQKEHLKLREDARKKREQELISRANCKKRDDEQRELNMKRKLQEEEDDIERQEREEEEAQLTGGIKYKQMLAVVGIEGEDDKAVLPESALESLTAQDSFGKGAAVFQLTLTLNGVLRGPNAASECLNNEIEAVKVSYDSKAKDHVYLLLDGTTRITHCGVREFSAAPGTIGLPPKVISSLWGDNSSAGSIEIKYVKLPKISYVKLEPTFNTFFKVEQVKMVLEENLKFHSTLTVGDVITVWFRGQAHPLKVVEMKPFDKGILLDTDVEVDLDNSLENKTTSEKFSSEKVNEVSKVKNDADQISSNSYHKLSSSTPSSSSSTISNINTPADACISTQNVPQNLPNEPEPDADDIVSVRVRTPTGVTINRRFYRKEPFSHLFEFASVEMRVEKKVLQLSTRFPNRVFTLNQIEATTSFLEMGITLPQELFLASVIM